MRDLFGAAAVAILAGCSDGTAPLVQPPPQPTWTQVWSDDFEGPAGAGVDPSKWSHDIGDGCTEGICGWGNNEKEYYTSAPENIALDGQGHLRIVARHAPTGLACYYGACRYTSAKITTRGKMFAAPGRVEARVRLPAGQGLWSAFWMLGHQHPNVPWPASGEIDIMENKGSQPTSIFSAVHGPGYAGATPFAHAVTLSSGAFPDDFHLFAVEWSAVQALFFVDDQVHYAIPADALRQYGQSILDQPFYLILNLAVGGHFDGDPASEAIFPATMVIDYVRVYRR